MSYSRQNKRKLDETLTMPNPNSRFKLSTDPIQFFVRTHKSLVLRASPESTISDVISTVRKINGENSTDPASYCLISNGRQLPEHDTLATCRISNDSTLFLASRLRSTQYPRSYQLVADLLLTASRMTEGRPVPVEIKPLRILLAEFLATTVSTSDSSSLDAFLGASGPAALVGLYLSNVPGCRAAADLAVSVFLRHAREYMTRNSKFAVVILEFCRLLAASAGRRDSLYVYAKETFFLVLDTLPSSYHSLKSLNLVSELCEFIYETADLLIQELDREGFCVLPAVVKEFSGFVDATAKAIKGCWRGTDGYGMITKALFMNKKDAPNESWIKRLYCLFVKLLGHVHRCLQKIKENPQSKCPDSVLTVLGCLQKLSKLYEGAPDTFRGILVTDKAAVNSLIHRAAVDNKLMWLLKYKEVTDFESKRNLVQIFFKEVDDDYEELHEMLIDRSQVLPESFEYIGQVAPQMLRHGLFIAFKNEDATGPGVIREWFSLVCRALFSPQNVLFLSCPNDRRRFFPNPASVVDPMHLKYYGFCGRIIALALMHKVQVGIVFDRVFFMQLAGQTVNLKDIKDADPCLYMSCQNILEMDAEQLDSDSLGLTFVRDIEGLGARETVELCPGGKDIVVNSNNREEYIKLLLQHRFVTSTKEQVSEFARGFGEILSNSVLRPLFFSSLALEDFDRILGGSDDINVSEWKSHTEYSGYRVQDPLIRRFWKVVEEMSESQQRVLLFFWTSIKHLPVDGFAGLGFKLRIIKAAGSADLLPTAHTCFFSLSLPQYPNIPTMRDRLHTITQEHISCTFGMY